jgi:hypothetical protein
MITLIPFSQNPRSDESHKHRGDETPGPDFVIDSRLRERERESYNQRGKAAIEKYRSYSEGKSGTEQAGKGAGMRVLTSLCQTWSRSSDKSTSDKAQDWQMFPTRRLVGTR